MNRIGIPESEWPALVAYLNRTYRYENGAVFNRRTGRRVRGSKMPTGYLTFTLQFKGGKYCAKYQRIVWILCNNELPTQTIDHINGDRLDNRRENLREVSMSENRLNMLLPWRPNKDTGVAGVECHGAKYRTRVRSVQHIFPNPYEAFYWAIACGKRYSAQGGQSPCALN